MGPRTPLVFLRTGQIRLRLFGIMARAELEICLFFQYWRLLFQSFLLIMLLCLSLMLCLEQRGIVGIILFNCVHQLQRIIYLPKLSQATNNPQGSVLVVTSALLRAG